MYDSVIFTRVKDDLRSIAALANLMGSSQSYGIKTGRTVGGPPSCPIKVGAGWHYPTDSDRSDDAFGANAAATT